MKVFIIYLIIMSIVAIAVTIYDKVIAGSGKRRVPENTLLIIAALGGSVAMYVTMQIIRHKTQHKKFMIGIPVIMVIQAILLALYLYWRSKN